MVYPANILSSERPSGVAAGFAAVAFLALGAALAQVFFNTPVESTMGVVQKIFYFHVPCAMTAYLGFTICLGGSLWYLLKGDVRGDVVARAGAELGVLFNLAVLISGPLWAKKAWGTYWTGEPRLLLTLVMMLIFFAYLIVRGLGGRNELTRKIGAVLAILGFATIPLVRGAVKLWRGNHPRVMTGDGGGIADAMLPGFAAMSIAIVAVFFALFWLRVRVGLAEEDAETWYRWIQRRRRAVQDLAAERA
jgi:heme exporter protein C